MKLQMEENWPLLTTSRGPFDSQLLSGAGSVCAQVAKAARAAAAFAHDEEADVVCSNSLLIGLYSWRTNKRINNTLTEMHTSTKNWLHFFHAQIDLPLPVHPHVTLSHESSVINVSLCFLSSRYTFLSFFLQYLHSFER